MLKNKTNNLFVRGGKRLALMALLASSLNPNAKAMATDEQEKQQNYGVAPSNVDENMQDWSGVVFFAILIAGSVAVAVLEDEKKKREQANQKQR